MSAMANLSAILLVLLAGGLWLESLRAREMALGLARRACERRDLQLLDQAVALRGVSIRWTREGLRLRRRYRFEYSEEGIGRRQAQLVLLGLRLESLWMEADEEEVR